jgi:hypothetical protein
MYAGISTEEKDERNIPGDKMKSYLVIALEFIRNTEWSGLERDAIMDDVLKMVEAHGDNVQCGGSLGPKIVEGDELYDYKYIVLNFTVFNSRGWKEQDAVDLHNLMKTLYNQHVLEGERQEVLGTVQVKTDEEMEALSKEDE